MGPSKPTNSLETPVNKLSYDPVSGEYRIGDWQAICVVGAKALVQTKRGKAVVCGILSQGKITERATGSRETLSGPWIVTSKGWSLDE